MLYTGLVIPYTDIKYADLGGLKKVKSPGMRLSM